MDRDLPPRITETLDRLRERTLELRTGDIDAGEFKAWLDKLEARFRRALEEVAEARIPVEMRAEMAEELEVGRRGVETFLHAVAALREWADSGEKSFLDTGLALATQATAQVNEAIQLNWRAFRTYQEAAREYLQQVGADPGFEA